jgi:hypothetical protein
MRRAVAMTIPVALLLAACGELQVKPSGIEQSIAKVVSGKTGVHATDIACPSGVAAKAGTKFDCHFLGPRRAKYVAHVQITAVKGNAVDFYIQTALSR